MNLGALLPRPFHPAIAGLPGGGLSPSTTLGAILGAGAAAPAAIKDLPGNGMSSGLPSVPQDSPAYKIGLPTPQPMAALPSKLGDLVAGLPQAKVPDHKGLFPGKDWKTILPMVLGAVGDGLAAYGGAQPQFAPFVLKKRMAEDEHKRDLEKFRAELESRRLEPRAVGGSLIQFNPQTGGYDTLYDAPQAPQQYASSLGFEPGTPEYKQAVEDYVLRANSDPAIANRMTLQDYIFDRREGLQGDRLATTRRGQDIRSRDMRRGQDMRPTRAAPKPVTKTEGQIYGGLVDRWLRGETLSPRETRFAQEYEARHTPKGRASRGASGNEPTATDANGRRIVVRNGRWVDAATGKPVQ